MYESRPYFYGTGRRKSSVARVRVYAGEGKITIDGQDYLLTQGQSIVMPARHPHAVYAQENFKMLLVVVF